MYSQAHISLFNIYWQVWLLVIRGPEKANLGSMEASGKQCKVLNSLLQLDDTHLAAKPSPAVGGKAVAQARYIHILT